MYITCILIFNYYQTTLFRTSKLQNLIETLIIYFVSVLFCINTFIKIHNCITLPYNIFRLTIFYIKNKNCVFIIFTLIRTTLKNCIYIII